MLSFHRKLFLILKKVKIAPSKFPIPTPTTTTTPFWNLENPGGGAQYLFKTNFASNS